MSGHGAAPGTRKRFGWGAFGLGLLAGLAIAAVLGLVGVERARRAWRSYGEPWKGFADADVYVEVPQGANARTVARILERAGVVRSAREFEWLLRLLGDSQRLQSGEYRFAEPATPRKVAQRLVAGDVFLHRVTLPEGLTLRQTQALLDRSGYWPPEEIATALARADLVRDLDPVATDLEGYLFPETYAFPRRTTAEKFVRMMVDRFRKVLGPEGPALAASLSLDVRGAVTLASLVEEEATLPTEQPIIASVFWNRLRRGMKLECDPTVLYAIRESGRALDALSAADLAFPSPYNTYLNPGLPPGPISSPGGGALRAVLHPPRTDYLFFVVTEEGKGGHTFSRDFPSHLRAVQGYRRSRRTGTGQDR